MSRFYVKNPTAVFDIGNVIVSLDNKSRDDIIAANQKGPNNISNYASLNGEILKYFRTGRITEEEYRIQLGNHFSVDPRVILKAEVALLNSLNKDLVERIYNLKKVARVVCLSNNQEIHWRELSNNFLPKGLFDECYLSHQIGLDKPDPNIFAHVAQAEQSAPSNLVLIDDDILNVKAAIAAGWTRSFVHRENKITISAINRIWARS